MSMIDVGGKDKTVRVAKARGFVMLPEDILEKIKSNTMPKGDVLATAKIAGIMAAKNTPSTLPLCHNIGLDSVKVEFKIESDGIEVESVVKATEKTGVEMEALTAVSVAALTIYDMAKMFSQKIEITDIYLLEKTGGKTGEYIRDKGQNISSV